MLFTKSVTDSLQFVLFRDNIIPQTNLVECIWVKTTNIFLTTKGSSLCSSCAKPFTLGFMIFCTIPFVPTNGLEFQKANFSRLTWNTFDDIPKSTTNISFLFCNVTYVEYNTFCNFQNLTYLTFSGNNLNTFKIAYNNLQVLNLANKQINSIDGKLLLNSPYLQVLYLEHNNLISIDWNLNEHFNLQKVILNENHLTTINLISPTLQELWIKSETGKIEFAATSKMEQHIWKQPEPKLMMTCVG